MESEYKVGDVVYVNRCEEATWKENQHPFKVVGIQEKYGYYFLDTFSGGIEPKYLTRTEPKYYTNKRKWKINWTNKSSWQIWTNEFQADGLAEIKGHFLEKMEELTRKERKEIADQGVVIYQEINDEWVEYGKFVFKYRSNAFILE